MSDFFLAESLMDQGVHEEHHRAELRRLARAARTARPNWAFRQRCRLLRRLGLALVSLGRQLLISGRRKPDTVHCGAAARPVASAEGEHPPRARVPSSRRMDQSNRQPGYLSYLLRLWQGDTTGVGTGTRGNAWCGSLESSLTGERQGFASLDELVEFLHGQTIAAARAQGEQA